MEIRVAMSQIFGLPVCLGDAEFGIAVREQPSGGSRAALDFCEALAPWAWQAAPAVALLAGFGQARAARQRGAWPNTVMGLRMRPLQGRERLFGLASTPQRVPAFGPVPARWRSVGGQDLWQ